MSVLITHGADTIEPSTVLGYVSGRRPATNVHPIVGRANPDVTFRPANLRTGTLELGFVGPTSEADSRAAEELHAAGGVFTLHATGRDSVVMSYVNVDTLERELEPESRDAWIVRVGYQEVTA